MSKRGHKLIEEDAESPSDGMWKTVELLTES